MFDKRYISLFLAIGFLAAGIVTGYLSFERQSPQAIADELGTSVQHELEKVEDDFEKIAQFDSFEKILSGKFHYPIYLFENRSLIFWSDNQFIPLYAHVADTSTIKFLDNGSGSYILKKKRLKNGRLLVSAVNLLKRHPINNDYLSVEYNKRILPSANVNILDPAFSLGAPVCSRANCFFRISIRITEFSLHRNLKIATVALIGFRSHYCFYLHIRVQRG